MKIYFSLFIIAIFLVSCNKENDINTYIYLPEKINSQLILKSDSTYVFSKDTYVKGDIIIEPGAVLKFQNSGLFIEGSIVASGKSSKPIIFTSINDNRFGASIKENSNNPTTGDWKGIFSQSDFKAHFKFCRFLYSHVAISSNIQNIHDSLWVENCIFSQIGYTGFNKDENSISQVGVIDKFNGFCSIKKSYFFDNLISAYYGSMNIEVDSSTQFNNYLPQILFLIGASSDCHLKKIQTDYLVFSGGNEKNSTITIDPGVRIYMYNNTNFEIKGKFNAIGTQDKHIQFIALDYDYNQYDEISAYLFFENNNNSSIFKYCDFVNYENILSPNSKFFYSIESEFTVQNCSFDNKGSNKRIGFQFLNSSKKNIKLVGNYFNDIPVAIKTNNLTFDLDNSNQFGSFYVENYGNAVIQEKIRISTNNPIILISNLVIPNNSELILDNAILKFVYNKGIQYNGSNLISNSTIFTSFLDDEHGYDSNGDSDFSKPYQNCWNGIFNTTTNQYEKWDNILYGRKN